MIYIEAAFNNKSHLHTVHITLEHDMWYAETKYCDDALEALNATKSSARDVVEGKGFNMEEAIRDLDDNLHDVYAAINHKRNR